MVSKMTSKSGSFVHMLAAVVFTASSLCFASELISESNRLRQLKSGIGLLRQLSGRRQLYLEELTAMGEKEVAKDGGRMVLDKETRRLLDELGVEDEPKSGGGSGLEVQERKTNSAMESKSSADNEDGLGDSFPMEIIGYKTVQRLSVEAKEAWHEASMKIEDLMFRNRSKRARRKWERASRTIQELLEPRSVESDTIEKLHVITGSSAEKGSWFRSWKLRRDNSNAMEMAAERMHSMKNSGMREGEWKSKATRASPGKQASGEDDHSRTGEQGGVEVLEVSTDGSDSVVFATVEGVTQDDDDGSAGTDSSIESSEEGQQPAYEEDEETASQGA